MPLAANADPAEALMRRFYEWELRGRGWDVWGDRVHPEPPFEPFQGHYLDDTPVFDDGRQHTLVSAFVERLRHWFLPADKPRPAPADEEPQSPPCDHNVEECTEFQIVLPHDFDPPREVAEQWLLNVSTSHHPVCFEVIATESAVAIQFAARQLDTGLVHHQLKAHFPDASVLSHHDLLGQSWCAGGEYAQVFELGLAREFMLPLCSAKAIPDIFVPITGALDGVSQSEIAVVQVMFAPVRHRWCESILRSCTYPDGAPVFEGFRDFVAGANLKIARPLFAAVVRLACRSDDPDRVTELSRHLFGSITGLSNPSGNEFIPLPNDDYDADQHEADLLERRSQRTGMLLNSMELSALVRLPSSSAQSSKLRGSVKSTKAAPAISRGNSFVLGTNRHAGETRPVSVSPEQRSRHTYIIGASGTGKSQLLLRMIVQDMEQGTGLALLDPHGDLVDEALARVPDARLDDLVVIDPSDDDYTVGFNILCAKSEIEKTVLASDLVAVFQRLSTSWGDQMTSVLGNAIQAFLERLEGGTLADLRRFLIEPAFRNTILSTVRDPQVTYYWKKQFPLLRGSPQASVLTRLDMFLRRKPIRHMVCLRERALDFADIMDTGKIVLAKIPQGLIGEENAHLLGTLLVSKFHQLAMARQEKRAAKRRPFFLYVDEFHHFVTPSMASILSEARKYRLGLILAHQELRQLDSRGVDLTSAVLSNPYTRICFRVGDQDASKLADGFSSFEATDLQSLGIGEAICRVERSDYDFNLATQLLPSLEESRVEERRTSAIARSRERYAVLRSSLADDVPEIPETVTVVETPTSPAPVSQPPAIPDIPKPTPARKSVTAPEEPPLMGRGGPEHKYLQQLIKQWADGMGYRATIEYKLPKGGSVDVLLEKASRKIACETGLTNSVAYEVENIRKCLDAACDRVVMVAVEEKHLTKIRSAATKAFNTADIDRVSFLSPDELFAFIQELEIQDAKKEATVRGYKIKTSYRATEPGEQVTRRRAVNQVVAKAMTRLRQKRQ